MSESKIGKKSDKNLQPNVNMPINVKLLFLDGIKYIDDELTTAAVLLRNTLETLFNDLGIKGNSLASQIRAAKQIFPENILKKIDETRSIGNRAVHYSLRDSNISLMQIKDGYNTINEIIIFVVENPEHFKDSTIFKPRLDSLHTITEYIREQGEIKVKKGSSIHKRIDELLKENLMIYRDDYLRTIQIKTTARQLSKAYISLFAKTPDWLNYKSWTGLIKEYGKSIEKLDEVVISLQNSVKCGQTNSFGWTLRLSQNNNLNVIDTDKKDKIITYWNFESINKKNQSKFGDTLFFSFERKIDKGYNSYKLQNAVFYYKYQTDKFLELVEEGKIFVDFRMKLYKTGKLRDHGTTFRILGRDFEELYQDKYELFKSIIS